jgi:hypothetical protein
MSHMNSGTRRERQEHHEPRLEVDRAGSAEHGDRNHAGQYDLREIAAEVRLEPVDALHCDGRQLCALGPIERGRLVAQPSFHQCQSRSSERTPAAAFTPATSNPQESAPRAAKARASQTISGQMAASEAP